MGWTITVIKPGGFESMKIPAKIWENHRTKKKGDVKNQSMLLDMLSSMLSSRLDYKLVWSHLFLKIHCANLQQNQVYCVFQS